MTTYERFGQEGLGEEVDYKDLLGRELLDTISHSVIESINGELIAVVAMQESYSKEAVEREVKQATQRAFELLCDETMDLLGVDLQAMGQALTLEVKDMMREAVYKIIDENNQLAKHFDRGYMIRLLDKHRDYLKEVAPGNEQAIDQEYQRFRKELADIPDEDLQFENFHEAFNSKYPIVKEYFQLAMHHEGSVSKFAQKREGNKEKRLKHILDVNEHRGKLARQDSFGETAVRKNFIHKLGKFFGGLVKKLESCFVKKTKDEMLNVEKLELLRRNIPRKSYDDLGRFKGISAAEALQAAALFALKDQMRDGIYDIDSIKDAVLHPKHVDRIVGGLGGIENIKQTTARAK